MFTIYACGGTGANIAKQIKDLDVDIRYIDSSTSNLKGVSEDDIFLIPDQDGAGKDRTITYENFKGVVEDVLIKFKPNQTLNVVISSLSGGSGSVVAPLVAKQLAMAGENVIVIGIDSKHSLIELNNSVKTLKTYKSISNSASKSISLFYVENTSRKEADQTVIRFINLLTILVDKKNTSEFDRTDLHNFINFDKVTDNDPSVAIIELGPNQPVTAEKNTVVASTILVTNDPNSVIHPVAPEYLSTCVVTDKEYTLGDIRIDNVLGRLAIIIEQFDEVIKKANDNKKINKYRDVAVDATDDDMVL